MTLDNTTLSGLDFPHGLYATVDGANENRSSGDVTAGNLSRSETENCFDERTKSPSYCYTTVIKVRLTEQTRCRIIGCRTRFRITIDGEDKLVYFGNATLARG